MGKYKATHRGEEPLLYWYKELVESLMMDNDKELERLMGLGTYVCRGNKHMKH